ncbi:MAG TPA: carbon storage regulator [Lacipirellulaceae bacterium]
MIEARHKVPSDKGRHFSPHQANFSAAFAVSRNVLEKGVSIMLVLSRKNRESVVVGGANQQDQLLKVTVLEIRRGKVVLGIEGERKVPVYREEIWKRMVHAPEGACA